MPTNSENGGEVRRARVIAHGRVQGVWFRDSARQEAERLGVTGWVRNLPDGTVEAVYEGGDEAVSAAIEWTRHGPEHASVTGLTIVEEPVQGDTAFRIR